MLKRCMLLQSIYQLMFAPSVLSMLLRVFGKKNIVLKMKDF